MQAVWRRALVQPVVVSRCLSHRGRYRNRYRNRFTPLDTDTDPDIICIEKRQRNCRQR
jgi:hypothetical protein